MALTKAGEAYKAQKLSQGEPRLKKGGGSMTDNQVLAIANPLERIADALESVDETLTKYLVIYRDLHKTDT